MSKVSDNVEFLEEDNGQFVHIKGKICFQTISTCLKKDMNNEIKERIKERIKESLETEVYNDVKKALNDIDIAILEILRVVDPLEKETISAINSALSCVEKAQKATRNT